MSSAIPAANLLAICQSVGRIKAADGYHVYALEWNEPELKYYVDGTVIRRLKNTHWHQALHLNFDSETMPDWFGLPKKEDLPSTFSIEYVRAWRQVSKIKCGKD